jgi:hypothetical protein
VLALMRIMEWQWWTALLAVVVMNLIPIVGQLGYLGLAVYGAFCLGSVHFSWSEAMRPGPAVLGFRGMAAEQFASYKPALFERSESTCVHNFPPEMGPGVDAGKFCRCVAQIVSESIGRGDMIYQEEHGGLPTQTVKRINTAVADNCKR